MRLNLIIIVKVRFIIQLLYTLYGWTGRLFTSFTCLHSQYVEMHVNVICASTVHMHCTWQSSIKGLCEHVDHYLFTLTSVQITYRSK